MKKVFSILFFLVSLTSKAQQEIYKRIDSALKAAYPNEKQPGFTMGIIKKGQLVHQLQVGLANLEYDVPFNEKTVVGLASITKQFTASCIAILERKGLLAVNDDVRKYIPELKFYGDTIRIRHLLNHSSGIRNHNVLLDLKGFDYQHRGYTNSMIENLMFKQQGINNKPGEKVLYSNTNYVLLALIVKRVSGKTIDVFAKEELFTPLGMHHTFYANNLENIVKNRAYPYYRSNGTYKQPQSLSLCIGAGGMGSTLEDMAKWAQVFLDTNSSFSFLNSFLTTFDPLLKNRTTNCARGVFVSPLKSYRTIHHGGRDLGMRSYFICIPELALGLMVYSNAEYINAEEISYKVLELLIPSKTQKQASNKVPVEFQVQNAVQFTGDYRELNSDLLLHISLKNDSLFAQSSFGNTAIPLVATSENQFHRKENQSVSYTFQPEFWEETDLIVSFAGANFYFEKVSLESSFSDDLNDFVGSYYSEELETTYSLTTNEKQLILNYPNHEGILLKRQQKEVFGSGRRTKYTFNRSSNGNINSFYVAAEGTVKNILFKKQ